jgi:threonine dehydrogenase-like Zn-dependent dehydrogenase
MSGKRLALIAKETTEIQPFAVTAKPAWGQSILRVSHSIISPGTEVSVIRAHNGPARGMGYTAVGRIESHGGGIDESLMGKAVFLFPAQNDQKECHASHKLVDRDAIYVAVPAGLDEGKACFARLINVALTPFCHLDAKVMGTCVVIGLGLVGNLAAQIAALRGFLVVGVDPDANRRKRAMDAGLVHAVDANAKDVVEQVRALTDGKGAMLTINATGVAATFMTALKCTATGGELSNLGGARGNAGVDLAEFLGEAWARHVTLRGGWEMLLPRNPVPASRVPSTEENVRLALRWLSEGKIKVEPIWTHRIKPEEMPGAYASLGRADAGYLGVTVDWRD